MTVRIDLQAAAAFIDQLREGDPVTFQTFDDRKKDKRLAVIRHGTLEQHGAELARLNEAGAGIFIMANRGDGKGRSATNVVAADAVFVDLDGAPLAPVLSASPEPHIVVESSPGRYHAWWQVDAFPLAQFTPVQKALAARFAGDPTVHDLPRVMRLPGFIHWKGEPFLTRVTRTAPAQPYALADLVAGLGLKLQPDASTPARIGPAQARGQAGDTFGEGGRNAALASMAGKMRRAGCSADAVLQALRVTNDERCRPPLPDDEVAAIARSIGRYAPGTVMPKVEFRQQPPADDEGAAATANEWPAPLLPGQSRVPDIDPALLGPVLGDMAATVAQHTQTPPAMAVMAVLAVLAAVLQRRFLVAPFGDDYAEPIGLYALIVLGPGNRKTAVFKAVTQVIVDIEKREADRMRREIAAVGAARDVVLKRIEALKVQAGREDDATKRDQLRDEIARLRDDLPAELFAPRLFTGDVTGERMQQMLVEQHERMAVISDEGGIFNNMAGSYGNGPGSIDVYLQGHAGSPMRVDRAGRMAYIDQPSLTFCIAIQPDLLQETGKVKRFRGSGLMARHLYVVPKSTVGRRDVRARIPIDAAVRAAYEARIEALYADTPRPIGPPRVIPFDEAAREPWLQLSEDIEARQGEGGRYAHMADWTSKLAGAAARIAALLALAEHGTTLRFVPVSAVQRAVQLARLLVPHAEAAFALMGASDSEADAHALLLYVQRLGQLEVERRSVQKAMEGRFRTVDRLLLAVKLLQDWHVLGPERKRGGVGRPSIYYEVNPKCFVDKSQLSSSSE